MKYLIQSYKDVLILDRNESTFQDRLFIHRQTICDKPDVSQIDSGLCRTEAQHIPRVYSVNV